MCWSPASFGRFRVAATTTCSPSSPRRVDPAVPVSAPLVTAAPDAQAPPTAAHRARDAAGVRGAILLDPAERLFQPALTAKGDVVLRVADEVPSHDPTASWMPALPSSLQVTSFALLPPPPREIRPGRDVQPFGGCLQTASPSDCEPDTSAFADGLRIGERDLQATFACGKPRPERLSLSGSRASGRRALKGKQVATPTQIRRRGRWSLVLGTLVAAAALASVSFSAELLLPRSWERLMTSTVT